MAMRCRSRFGGIHAAANRTGILLSAGHILFQHLIDALRKAVARRRSARYPARKRALAMMRSTGQRLPKLLTEIV